MFLVLATHNTGHGEVTDPVYLTDDLAEAVRIARNIEDLGYEFYSNEVGVMVYRLQPERPYRKDDFKIILGKTPTPVCVFFRRHTENHGHPEGSSDDCWKEEWFDPTTACA